MWLTVVARPAATHRRAGQAQAIAPTHRRDATSHPTSMGTAFPVAARVLFLCSQANPSVATHGVAPGRLAILWDGWHLAEAWYPGIVPTSQHLRVQCCAPEMGLGLYWRRAVAYLGPFVVYRMA